MTDAGLFLTFEGVEGSGKTTQMRLLVERLRGLGYTVVENYEPGGTEIGRQIRRIVLGAGNQNLSPTAELLLFFASRAQAVDEVILPALAKGHIVISDRFTDSTLVYQGYARGLGREVVLALDKVACRGLAPRLTLCLDLDIELGLQRARARNAEDAHEETRLDDESLQFHKRVREAYHDLARREPERVKLIDAGQTPEAVADCIWRLVECVLPRLG
ncbi:MAG: dTMP kinase [Bryobacterales bacterium]|nr:dTMP kinase [Bryobacterales bacterium]